MGEGEGKLQKGILPKIDAKRSSYDLIIRYDNVSKPLGKRLKQESNVYFIYLRWDNGKLTFGATVWHYLHSMYNEALKMLSPQFGKIQLAFHRRHS